MFKIHFDNGKTIKLDMADDEMANKWLKHLRDISFQKSITGITIVKTCGGKFRCSKCNRTRLACTDCGHSSRESTCRMGVQFSLTRPNGFKKSIFVPELVEPNLDSKIRGGEKVTCFAGDTKLSLMVHSGQPASRMILSRVGNQVYNPFLDGGKFG